MTRMPLLLLLILAVSRASAEGFEPAPEMQAEAEQSILRALLIAKCERLKPRAVDLADFKHLYDPEDPAKMEELDQQVKQELYRAAMHNRRSRQLRKEVYFVTTSWVGERDSLPRSFHESISDLELDFRPASQAFMKDGCVFCRRTEQRAALVWISADDWISDTEVTISHGVFRGPWNGCGSRGIWHRSGGEWRPKSYEGSFSFTRIPEASHSAGSSDQEHNQTE